jgi:hypothetical protein
LHGETIVYKAEQQQRRIHDVTIHWLNNSEQNARTNTHVQNCVEL